jgi:hypothetical protein
MESRFTRFAGARASALIAGFLTLAAALPAFAAPDNGAAAEPPEGRSDDSPSNVSPKLFDRSTLRVGGAFVLAAGVGGYFAWWKNSERHDFHTTAEGWFGRNTYAGGADKTSHFVASYAAATLASSLYRSLGKTDRQAAWLGAGTALAASAVVEIGDGFSDYGFSWEDLVTNGLGAATAAAIERGRLGDTIGFRWGPVHAQIPGRCCRAHGLGRDYSQEIATMDLKLAGLLPRIGVAAGPARFLLLSLTYGSKGYRFSPWDHRERDLGVEVGLNLAEIGRALGLSDEKPLAKAILTVLTFIRLPYTAIGYRYDFNHSRWKGPDSGEKFDPGAVIYR